MAKAKKKRSRQSGFSKVINMAIIALGFARPLTLLIRSPSEGSINTILNEATFGLATGKLDLAAGARMYSPAGAAIGLGKLKQYLMRHFPVR